MQIFQCLLFVLKRSYLLLYNLHDCTFNKKHSLELDFKVLMFSGGKERVFLERMG